jgi:hypothetical protein
MYVDVGTRGLAGRDVGRAAAPLPWPSAPGQPPIGNLGHSAEAGKNGFAHPLAQEILENLPKIDSHKSFDFGDLLPLAQMRSLRRPCGSRKMWQPHRHSWEAANGFLQRRKGGPTRPSDALTTVEVPKT